MNTRFKGQMGLILNLSHCLSAGVSLVNIILASIDGLIAATAYTQLLRIHLRNCHVGWTRQKVFHFMIGTSNIGGDALVDLCHQATDKEEEEEEEDDDMDYVVLPEHQGNKPIVNPPHAEKHRRCCSIWRRSHIRSRQKFVIAVVLLICVLTVTFSVLIWIGTGRNPINSSTLAQIYSDLFAIVILMSGGGLAGYGLLLYLKMSRVRSGKSSADIQKVAGLAAVAVVCFTLRALLVLCTDVPVLNIWHPRHAVHSQSPLLIFLYYFIGSSIPSGFVLWVMREMPPRPVDDSRMRPSSLLEDTELLPDDPFVQHWIVPTNGQNQITVSQDCHPVSSNFQVGQECPR